MSWRVAWIPFVTLFSTSSMSVLTGARPAKSSLLLRHPVSELASDCPDDGVHSQSRYSAVVRAWFLGRHAPEREDALKGGPRGARRCCR